MLVADPAGRLVGDTPRAAPRRALGNVCLGCAGAQPMGVHRRADPRRARSPPTAGTRCARSLQHGERGAHACACSPMRDSPTCAPTRYRWLPFRDLDDYERWVSDLSGSFATVLRGLPEGELEALRAELRTAFEPYATQQGYELGGARPDGSRQLSYLPPQRCAAGTGRPSAFAAAACNSRRSSGLIPRRSEASKSGALNRRP